MRSSKEGVDHAVDCWNRGCNCAESTLSGVCHALDIELSVQCLRMATPFGGGIGRSEDICGAMTGALLAIGAARGRSDPKDDKSRSYGPAGEFYKRFVEEFESSKCRELNNSDFTTPNHRDRCTKYVIGATRLAINILGNER